MTAPPPGQWGGSSPTPPAPPPGPPGGNRTLIVAIAGVVVVAAAAILAIVLISNSGGDSTSGAASTPPVASVSRPPSQSLTASGVPPRRSSTSNAPSSSAAAGGPLDCAGISAAPALKPIATFAKGGALPSGVPLPQAVPALTCAGTGTSGGHQVSLVAVSWKSVTLAQYDAQLRGSGWTEQNSGALKVYKRSGAAKAIVLTDVNGQLVAVYGPPK